MTRPFPEFTDTIMPLQALDQEDLAWVAGNLNSLLKRSENEDISIHFPGTVQRYGGDIEDAKIKLREAAMSCELGRREQFVVTVGCVAVGMSIVTNEVTPPVDIDPSWPNLSGFVLYPYREHGIARRASERCMQAVHENFGDHAWTYVRKGNIPAEKRVLGAGFERTSIVVPGQEHQHLYVYEA